MARQMPTPNDRGPIREPPHALSECGGSQQCTDQHENARTPVCQTNIYLPGAAPVPLPQLAVGVEEPLDMPAIAANQNRGAAVSPIKIEKRKESRVELRVGLLELVASAMRAHHLPARHLVRPIVFHATPKPLKEPHRRSFLVGKNRSWHRP